MYYLESANKTLPLTTPSEDFSESHKKCLVGRDPRNASIIRRDSMRKQHTVNG